MVVVVVTSVRPQVVRLKEEDRSDGPLAPRVQWGLRRKHPAPQPKAGLAQARHPSECSEGPHRPTPN